VAAALRHVGSLSHGPPLDASLRVTLHFHPDRLVDGRPLLEHLASDGVYRSQFETFASNGGLTAHEGGERWHWEQRMFGGAYDSAVADARPKYGSLNHRRRPAGGSIRFGSAHLRLAQSTLTRTTFCYPDSVFDPTAFGTADHLGLIGIADADHRDLLDDYIEAHVHGPLRLDADVEALVLDPAYRGTDIETAASALPVPLEWHHGFRLHVDELAQHPSYRGAEVVAAGISVAEDGWLDARVIGIAARSVTHHPQTLKRLWHCTARFGHPVERLR
jgi:hypothetical protein